MVSVKHAKDITGKLWMLNRLYLNNYIFSSYCEKKLDSLFSFEGGSSNAATKPLMPNLEIEAATITASTQNELLGNIDNTLKRDDFLSELNTLTNTFSDLESSMDYKSQLYEETISTYQYKVSSLEEKNAMLEKGLTTMSATLEKQGEQRQVLQRKKEVSSKTNDVQEENDMLRQRVRALELQLSEIAFESRKVTVSAVSPEVTQRAKHLPKAPSAPVPLHISQPHRSGLHKFGLGFRHGMSKLGKVVNVWSPVYNLGRWGELRGQGKMVM